MPLYMDIHRLEGYSREDLAKAHVADLAAQDRHGVRYLKYWFNEDSGTVFCLVDAPDPEAAAAVHREAHGLLPEEIIEVQPLAVEQFLGDAVESPSGAAVLPGPGDPTLDGGFRTVLFTDIQGSTDFTQKLGDATAMRIIRRHNAIIRTALEVWNGREVKHTGDGIMAAFRSASGAVACAIEIQRKIDRDNRRHPEGAIGLRVGLSAGEPVEDDADLFGASVQLAARACAHAQPGQILVSNVVAELCIGKGFDFRDRGPAALKGFEHPVRLHEVVWSEEPQGGRD